MKKKYLIEEILHKYDSDGNVFFVLGGVTGNVDDKGQDILREECTIVIPSKKIDKFSNQFFEAVNFKESESFEQKEINTKVEQLGKPIIFKK